MGAEGVKPAMLTVRSEPLVTIVTGAPLRRPATSESALALPPAHSAYCDERRVASVAGAGAAIALAATASEAASDAASARVFMWAVSFLMAPLCSGTRQGSVGWVREWSKRNSTCMVVRFLLRVLRHMNGCARFGEERSSVRSSRPWNSG